MYSTIECFSLSWFVNIHDYLPWTLCRLFSYLYNIFTYTEKPLNYDQHFQLFAPFWLACQDLMPVCWWGCPSPWVSYISSHTIPQSGSFLRSQGIHCYSKIQSDGGNPPIYLNVASQTFLTYLPMPSWIPLSVYPFEGDRLC